MKRLVSSPKRIALGLSIVVFGGLLSFQNCAQVSFEAATQASNAPTGGAGAPDGDVGVEGTGSQIPVTPTKIDPQYAELRAGDSANFPKLKLVFVVDNSGTMQANQISLASSFSTMFEGDNAKSLAPFDTTAFVLSTSQMSVKKSDDAVTYSRLPRKGPAEIGSMSSADLSAGPRASIIDGTLAGDLVGYRAIESTVDGLTSTDYRPAPVVGISTTGGQTVARPGAHKPKDAPVADFARDFRDRIAVLDPARSAIDPNTKRGILDKVVDQESGLCALARVMKHSNEYFQPGDMAAFVVVTDENDADEKGLSCLESVKDLKGAEDLVDGQCVTPRTELTYRPANPNPSAANCAVSYQTGFKYKYTYNLPKTDTTYTLLQRDYKIRQTKIEYSSATHTYSQPKFVISYFTKSPTYKVPQSQIKYFKKVETCESIRDNVKFNCTFSYPSFTTAVFSESFTDCKAFASGKLPADAIQNDAAHPVTCQALAPIAKSGACTVGAPNVLECEQNYSAARKDSGTYDGTAPEASACASFAAGKLEASAVLSDSGYAVTCKQVASVAGLTGTGLCPSSPAKPDCKNVVTPLSVTVDGLPTDTSAGACQTFATAKKSSLNANAVLGNASYPVSCPEGAGRTVLNENGACSGLDGTTKVCIKEHAAASVTSRSFNGQPASGQTCLDFVKASLGASVALSGTSVTCAPSATPQVVTSSEKTILYTSSVLANYTAAAGADCLTALKAHISVTDKITDPKTCAVTSLVSGNLAYNQGKTCEQMADANQQCTNSKGAYRGCVATSTASGDPLAATPTTVTLKGEFTCTTACSQTSFCTDKPGTVGDNYAACSVVSRSTTRAFTRELASNAKICSQPDEKPQPVITKGPYREVGQKPVFVAGALSEQGMPNALATYIRERAAETFATLPSVSVFVRQPGDTLGTNGSLGAAYNTFADMMGGQKRSALSGAQDYAASLQALGGIIRKQLDRSFNVQVGKGQSVKRIWHRKPGAASWGDPVDASAWTAAGGTVTFLPGYQFDYGDEFRFEYF